MDKNNPKDNLGVFGANVFWLNTSIGATTRRKRVVYKFLTRKTIRNL